MRFKVFDKEKKEFVEEEYKSFVLTQDGDLRFVVFHQVKDCYDHFIPVFHLGRRDKKGNELYQGDMIKYVEDKQGEHTKTVYSDSDLHGLKLSYWEKIGSIYTNPELMEIV